MSAEPFYKAIAGSVDGFHFAGRVVVAGDPEELRGAYPALEILDARRGALADPRRMLDAVAARCSPFDRDLILFDSIEAMVGEWGAPAVADLFVSACPLMLEIGAIAYWTASAKLSEPDLSELRRVAQCAIAVGVDRVRVVKADGRGGGVEGRVFRINGNDGAFTLTPAPAVSRVGEALRAVREELELSQTDLARLAGVTPSAVSQAERGSRGLSLETLLLLTERLGISIDQFLQGTVHPAYRLARRHDPRERGEGRPVPLLDDNITGYRLHAVYLPPHGAAVTEPAAVDAEIVAIASGLVQVFLPTASPILRQGEALSVERASIVAWRNLSDKEALLFWIARPPNGPTVVADVAAGDPASVTARD